MKRLPFGWLVAALPALAGSAAWLTFRLGWLLDYVVFLRAKSLATLLLATGWVLSVLCGAGVAAYSAFVRRERRHVEELLAQEAAKRGQFLRRLDHELKNPLTAMQIELANLEAESGTQAEVPFPAPAVMGTSQQAVQRLRDQVMRVNDLVIPLRKLGELERHPIEREPVRLDELLADLVAEIRLREPATQRDIALTLPKIPWPLPPIEGDPDLVYLALRNVLDNAVKFTRPGDAIQVRAFEDGTYVVVEIADQGPGIPADELPHVWEELYRGQLARGLPGSGLGLPIVKTIAERHGGHVSLRSRVNQGTAVTIRWPARM